ncbi:NfeD family protein [Ruminiclostridium herbifermentans]|uniref:NfeD family protein n=1 Tax=Ruminiclostridium herbifermentans TaxID=2488810 RepID=A0A4U7JM44_9FIRM|nr:NfeD family protein [Ruminiclostridium herbifermentans]QNU68151.1 NfeD family protein [Ruminiclostridium herbifermentans]
MSDFYVVVFLVGVFYTVISLIINGITGALHSHGDFGADIGGHHGNIDSGHVQADAGHTISSADGSQAVSVDGQQGHSVGEGSGFSQNIISWFAVLLNPIVAVSLLTVFGGMGILGESYFKWDSIATLAFAAVSGILCSSLLYNFVAKPIYRSENTSNVSREMLIGTAAEVTTDILADGFGTISYTVNSLRFNAPSKHIEGKAVKQGQKVVICKIEDNIFYISEISGI